MNALVQTQERNLPPAAAVRAELETMKPQFAMALLRTSRRSGMSASL